MTLVLISVEINKNLIVFYYTEQITFIKKTDSYDLEWLYYKLLQI